MDLARKQLAALEAVAVEVEERLVVLQVARGSEGWITFRQMTTDSEGRFMGSYRFNRTFYDYTYTFRALVPRQAGYFWLAGASPLVTVEVKG